MSEYRVGDIVDVSPNAWDCLVCTRSLEAVNAISNKVTCPRCGSLMELSNRRMVERVDVKLIRRWEED
jgi:hypothetical protein